MDKQKREKFLRLAEKRSENVINGLKKLSKLANKKYYEYSPDDIKNIYKIIMKELQYSYDSFKSKKSIMKLY